MRGKRAFLAGFRPRRGLAGSAASKRLRLLDENELVAVGELQAVLIGAVLNDHFAVAGKEILTGYLGSRCRLAGRLRSGRGGISVIDPVASGMFGAKGA
jgi:hypothetical protein